MNEIREIEIELDSQSEESDLPEECWDFQSELMLTNYASEHIVVQKDDDKCSICYDVFKVGEKTT